MKTETTSIVFTGDIGFDKYMDQRWTDDTLLSSEVLSFLCSADHVVANVEGAMIAVEADGSRSTFFHAMNPEAACVLKQMGADIWAICNNHSMDAGLEGLESTRKIAQQMGFQTVGAGKNLSEASEPVWLDAAGGIGILCVGYQPDCVPAGPDTPGNFSWSDMDLIETRIREIKETCRWCIVISHGGEEFAPMPIPYTRKRYLKYLELGADVVVGHHPHVPENYEILNNGKAIFYSLGNFIFDTDYQRAHAHTDQGVLLKLILSEDALEFEAMGIQLARGEERIDAAPLPEIFTDIPETEYQLLAPLAAKSFVAEERRKMVYLEPERFANASEEVWMDYFFSGDPDGHVEGDHMDFFSILPLAETAEAGSWKESCLQGVKDYLLGLIG